MKDLEPKEFIFLVRKADKLLEREIINIAIVNNAHRGAQGLVLKTLTNFKNHGERCYQKDLEKAFGIRRSSVSTILNCLEKDGFIKRIVVENDLRAKEIILTELGEKECLKMEKSVNELNMNLKSLYSKKEYQEIVTSLITLINYLDKKEGKHDKDFDEIN